MRHTAKSELTYKTMTHITTQVITKDIIEKIDLTKHIYNKYNYIVLDTEKDGDNIAYILLNINVFDYFKKGVSFGDCDLTANRKKGLFYYENWNSIDEIENFLFENGECYIEDLKTDLINNFYKIKGEIIRLG